MPRVVATGTIAAIVVPMPATTSRSLPLLILLLLGGWTNARAELTTALGVRSLTAEQSREKLPVSLRGVISFIESTGTAFIQDATAGTHIHMKPGRSDLRIGDEVEVRGVTMPGLYLPGVEVRELKIPGHGSAPTAVPAGYDDLATGRFHYQTVVVEGVGRSLSPLDENRALLRLAMGSRVIEVRIDTPPESAPDVIDARLRVTALAAGGINDRRQLVFPYLRVTDWENVIIAEPARAIEKLAVTPVARLLRFGAQDEAAHRVRVRGVVLASFADGRLFVRDVMPEPTVPPSDEAGKQNEPLLANALGIRLNGPTTVPIGQVVEAVGFPVMDRFSATLVDSIVDRTVHAPALPADSVLDASPSRLSKPAALLSGSHDSDLVMLEAQLVDLFRSADGIELRLDADGASVRALLPAASTMPSVALGSMLELTGICQVESSTDTGFRSRPDRALLLLRHADDLRLVHAPTWWTARRLIQALGALVGVLVGGALWITILRRQVARQGAALRERIASEAALEERQRIAREFHDTLEQELAGLSLRLDAATTRPLDEKARGLLDTSRHLVSRIQSEARNLVADLRTDPHASADLTVALRELADHALHDLYSYKLDIPDPIPELPAHLVHHLRMIAQEAITNALKHAQPTLITIGLRLTEGRLVLRIEDNGRGFDPDDETHGKPGHFGCVGIRERCRLIGAEAEWQSQPGKGTSIIVILPLPPA